MRCPRYAARKSHPNVGLTAALRSRNILMFLSAMEILTIRDNAARLSPSYSQLETRVVPSRLPILLELVDDVSAAPGSRQICLLVGGS